MYGRKCGGLFVTAGKTMNTNNAQTLWAYETKSMQMLLSFILIIEMDMFIFFGKTPQVNKKIKWISSGHFIRNNAMFITNSPRMLQTT